MERGIYCHNWGHRNHNMHPSMPIHTKALVEDFKKLKGTMVCWAAMGGGSVSLPYLEHEANGPVHPRMLYHGYMNDREYIRKCREAGLDVFAVFYEAQGWEVPAVLSEDGKHFERLNIVDEGEEHDWYGLGEFTRDRHWEVFGKKLEDYFPGGLVNSDGKPVTDLFEECTTRDMHGKACRAEWVEVHHLPQVCHLMCRNNPVWRRYIKRATEIMIDNGARGIQLDETETPITSLRFGGCFCWDCMKQFNQYLKERKTQGTLPKELEGVNLDTFNYAEYLISVKSNYPQDDLRKTPLFDLYWDFQIRTNNLHFREVVAHIREYARYKGVKVRISANIFNLYLYNYPSWNELDVMVTELDHTLFKRHDWFRYAAGTVGNTPVLVAENPYGGMIPAFLEQLKNGKAYDLFRIFLMEAAVHGLNMCVPYGGWMGSEIRDAFFPPFDVAVEVQEFLAANEDLFGRKSGANVKILYSFPSYTLREPMAGQNAKLIWNDQQDLLSYRIETGDDAVRMPYWEAAAVLQRLQVNYDASVLPDGDIVADDFRLDSLKGYELVVLPDCTVLTANQTEVLKRFTEQGGRLVVYGEAACDRPDWKNGLKSLPTVWIAEKGNNSAEGAKAFETEFSAAYEPLRQLSWDSDELFVQLAEGTDKTVVHVLNYKYDRETDRISGPENAVIRLKRSKAPVSISTKTLDAGMVSCEWSYENGVLSLQLSNLSAYTAVILMDE